METAYQFKWPITTIILVIFFVIFFRKELSQFLKEISWLKTKWFELKRIQEEVFAKTEEVKQLSKELAQDKEELRNATKVFVESFYLTLQTRNIFPIPQPIALEIEKNINSLANFAIEDEDERKKWVTNIQSKLNQVLPK